MLSCGWLEGGGGRLVVRTHIERKELESRPRLTVAPGNGLERCSPMRRRWLRGHRPCVGSYGPLPLGVSIVRQCPSCLCRSGWQENSGRRSGQRQGARQVKPGSHRTEELRSEACWAKLSHSGPIFKTKNQKFLVRKVKAASARNLGG